MLVDPPFLLDRPEPVDVHEPTTHTPTVRVRADDPLGEALHFLG